MKRNLLALIYFLFLFGTQVSAQEILLPDQIYSIKLAEKVSGAKVINTDDELIIYDNKVSAAFSKKDGFPPAVIYLQQEDKLNSASITFTAGCTNSKNATLKWSGTIHDGKVEGKVQKFFMGTLAGEYILTGTRKKKK